MIALKTPPGLSVGSEAQKAAPGLRKGRFGQTRLDICYLSRAMTIPPALIVVVRLSCMDFIIISLS